MWREPKCQKLRLCRVVRKRVRTENYVANDNKKYAMSKNIQDNEPGTGESSLPLSDGSSRGFKNPGQEPGQPRSDDFSKELVSLLKSQPGCSIWLPDFCHRYEQHFGNKFNVTEHGHTTLKELFKALPHLVSMMNEDNSCIAIKLKPTNYVNEMATENVPRINEDPKAPINDKKQKLIKIDQKPDSNTAKVERNVSKVEEGKKAETKRQRLRAKAKRQKEGRAIFIKELTELFKYNHCQPGDAIEMRKFGAIYERRFGKKFNYKEYGYGNYWHMMESMPEVHVSNSGPHALITLTQERDVDTETKHLTSMSINNATNTINPVVKGVTQEVTATYDMRELQEIGRRSRAMRRKAPVFCKDLSNLLLSRPRQKGMSINEFIAIYQIHFGNHFNLEEKEFTTGINLANEIQEILHTQNMHLVGTGSDTCIKFKENNGNPCQCWSQNFKGAKNPSKLHNKKIQECDEEGIEMSQDEPPSVLTLPAPPYPKVEAVASSELPKAALRRKALVFCRDLTMLLNSRPRLQGGLSITEFKAIYHNHFGNNCNFEEYGFTIGMQWVYEIQKMLHKQNVHTEGIGSEACIKFRENNCTSCQCWFRYFKTIFGAKSSPEGDDNEEIQQSDEDCIDMSQGLQASEFMPPAPPFSQVEAVTSSDLPQAVSSLQNYFANGERTPASKELTQTDQINAPLHAPSPASPVLTFQDTAKSDPRVNFQSSRRLMCRQLMRRQNQTMDWWKNQYKETVQRSDNTILSVQEELSRTRLSLSRAREEMDCLKVQVASYKESSEIMVSEKCNQTKESTQNRAPLRSEKVEVENANKRAQDNYEVAQHSAQDTNISDREDLREEFAQECVELLMDTADQRIPLNIFQDKYYQNFGRICRPPSDYGFSDLVKLFEAMPYTVKVTGSENCARNIELAESTLLSVVELPMDDTSELEDDEGNKTILNSRRSLGYRSPGIKRSFAFVRKKQ